jgi:hypothetical protein
MFPSPLQWARWLAATAPANYQPTATTMYCGLLTEMSDDCPASSS